MEDEEGAGGKDHPLGHSLVFSSAFLASISVYTLVLYASIMLGRR
jgi:hypothetical protein